jgi:hypothetical protein
MQLAQEIRKGFRFSDCYTLPIDCVSGNPRHDAPHPRIMRAWHAEPNGSRDRYRQITDQSRQPDLFVADQLRSYSPARHAQSELVAQAPGFIIPASIAQKQSQIR